jgi:hypothetical protein
MPHAVFDLMPPDEPVPTPRDRELATTYLRLLDADADGAPWQEVARVVLGLDPDRDPAAAQIQWAAFLARAQFVRDFTKCG